MGGADREAVVLLRGLACAVAVGSMAGCAGYESAYEKGVYAYEPIYCYRTLADIDCLRAPDLRAERRLVNYYGPSPRRAPRPAPSPPARLDPPPTITGNGSP
jgi:hypothetical protein